MNVRTLCLGILHFTDATGYEIRKMAAEGDFRHFVEASYGAIYPALSRLMEEGLVECRTEHADGKPSRKIYTITDAGRIALREALYEPPRPDVFKSEFLFLTLFDDLVDPAHLLAMIEQRIVFLRDEQERLHAAREDCGTESDRFAIRYGEALNLAALELLEAERDRLTSADRRPAKSLNGQAERPAEPGSEITT
ncbi:MAG: PadR family transcriptional regulator [Pseudomonadota bacterium]